MSMMNMLPTACAAVGWSKLVWFPFITSLKTHFECEKSGGWKAGAVPRGLSVGNFECIYLPPLPQVEEGILGRGGAQLPSLQLMGRTGGTKPALQQKPASCGGFNPLRAAPP